MTSINHSNNLSLDTLHFPSSTPLSSSAASLSSLSSTNWTERITKKIQELKKQLENLSNLKEAQSGYLPEEDSKSLDSLPTQLSALQTMQQLAEFAESLTKKTKNDNILTHLCDGLQTFLGFNPSSKGYTGSGIVYSDLDRLCDGVMGFLKGVLESVKTDDAVVTYDKNDDLKLEKVITTLSKQIGSGRTGLVASVGVVKRWLEGYELEYSKKASNVTEFLGELKTKIAGTYTNNVAGAAGEKLATQLTAWKETVQKIDEEVKNIENAHVNKLDSKLHDQIKHKISPVRKVVEHLSSVASNPAFETQVIKVEYEMNAKKSEVLCAINAKAEELKRSLDSRFSDIIRNIDAIDFERNTRLAYLLSSVKQLAVSVGDAEIAAQRLEQDYARDIVGKLKKMNGDVNELDTTDMSYDMQQIYERIRQQLLTLDGKLEEIRVLGDSTIAGMKGGLTGIEAALDKEIELLKREVESSFQMYLKQYVKLVKEQVGRIKDTMNIVNPNGNKFSTLYTNVSDFTSKVSRLEDAYQEELKRIRSAVSNDLTSKLRNDVKQLKKSIEKDLCSLKGTISVQMVAKMQEIVRKIRGEVGHIINGQVNDSTDGLSGIKEKIIKDYAQGFEKFEEKMEEWITTILEKDPFKELLSSYFKQEDNENKLVDELRNGGDVKYEEANRKIAAIFVKHLSNQISAVTIKSVSNVKSNIEAVKQGIDTFVGKLEGEIGATKISALASKIEADIKTPGHDNTSIFKENPDDSKSYDLTLAVRYTLTALSSAAKRFAEELNSLILSNRGPHGATSRGNFADNLERVLGVASELEKKLQKSGSSVQSNTNFADEVDKEITSVLDEKMGPDGNIKYTDIMKTYMPEVESGKPLQKTISGIESAVNRAFDRNGDGINTSLIRGYDMAKPAFTNAVKGALNYITKMEQMYPTVTRLDTDLNTALTGNAGSDVDTDISVADNFDARVKKHVDAVNFKSPLNALLTSAARKGIDMFNEQLNLILDGDLKNVNPKIGDEIIRLSNDANGNQHENMQLKLSALQKDIKKVQTSVADTNVRAGGNIKIQVTSLKETVSTLHTAIRKIDTLIQQFDASLLEYIGEAKLTIETACEALTKQITSHKSELINTAQEAFNAIYTEVKKMFADSHKADLKALKDLVDKRNRDIEDIISVDKVTGLKGLLWHMYGDNGRNIKMLEANEFKHICTKFKQYSTSIFDYITEQVRSHPSNKEAKKVEDIKNALNVLFGYLTESEQRKFFFDDKSQTHLDKLNGLVSQLAPSLFAGYRHPQLLDALKSGLGGLTEQLDKAYVNRYVGGDGIEKWLTEVDKGELTAEGRKGATVLVTCLPGLLDGLTQLIRECRHENSQRRRISLTENRNSVNATVNPIGSLLKDFGYLVSQSDKQEGELRNDTKCNGDVIVAKLGMVDVSTSRKRLLLDIIDELISHLRTYYCVCHLGLPVSPKYPSTIRDMLGWMCGLPYTTVFSKVDDHCQSSLEKDALSKNDAVLKPMLQRDLYSSLVVTCRKSHNVLVTICGNGNGSESADYPYASAFLNNSQGFLYPSDVASLFDMLRDICTRLLYQLYFVYSRCRTSSKCLGWRDCYYGQHIGGSSWECNTYQCPNQRCAQNTNQIGKQIDNQNADQICKQHPSCGIKSPLQSFLEDGLRGFMPHNVSSDGKSITCSTCPKTAPGQPCITPMGFYDLATAGSITKRGITLYSILHTLCGNADASLPSLLRCLNALCPVAPKCLADMFSLYCNLMQIWKSTAKKYEHDNAYKSNIEKAIGSCFPFHKSLHNNYTADMLTDKVKDLYCSDNDHHSRNHNNDLNHRGLQSLSTKPTTDFTQRCSGKEIYCGPYLHSLGHNAHHTYAGKNVKTYLSCIVYLSEVFWELLNQLLQAFQNISCKRYGCSSCNCISGKHGVSETDLSKPPTTPEPQCRCASIVNCQGALSIFYQYGFTPRGPSELMEGPTKRLCDDFVKQMERVLTSKYFRNLLSQCDEFLWAIRSPFFWLNVALWLLSLLYLIHIMVIRLDLLHIESHLHSPSSHRIAAQSLLAAARVNKLNRVFYLQP